MHRVIARMCVMEISIDIKVVAWCTSYQLHAQDSVSQFFGYHFSLRGVIGKSLDFFLFFLYSYNIMYLQYNLCLSHGARCVTNYCTQDMWL